MLLEIACFSLEAAILAEESGADRIELCSGPLEGGLTPSFSMILLARNILKIPIHVMVRPREGNFLYTPREIKSMEHDIEMMKETGINGIVLGLLNKTGSVDIQNLTRMVKIAEPMNVTFHRAFDLCQDPFQSLNGIMQSGAARILTSGQTNSAPEGKELIAKLISLAEGKIVIMPGSGVNALNIGNLCKVTGATEIHASARRLVEGGMSYSNPKVDLHGGSAIKDNSVMLPDPEQIRKMKNELTNFI
jgi:copper homeostasis protein